ncbi:SWAHB protein, partial [Polyodon spathula]|nr:SWAHB protein [Polyodon spathula]
MATQFSQDAVLDFLCSRGGSVKNSDLITHFKTFLREHENQVQHRDMFKKFVNSVAVVKRKDGVSFVILQNRYRELVGEDISSAEKSSNSGTETAYSDVRTSEQKQKRFVNYPPCMDPVERVTNNPSHVSKSPQIGCSIKKGVKPLQPCAYNAGSGTVRFSSKQQPPADFMKENPFTAKSQQFSNSRLNPSSRLSRSSHCISSISPEACPDSIATSSSSENLSNEGRRVAAFKSIRCKKTTKGSFEKAHPEPQHCSPLVVESSIAAVSDDDKHVQCFSAKPKKHKRETNWGCFQTNFLSTRQNAPLHQSNECIGNLTAYEILSRADMEGSTWRNSTEMECIPFLQVSPWQSRHPSKTRLPPPDIDRPFNPPSLPEPPKYDLNTKSKILKNNEDSYSHKTTLVPLESREHDWLVKAAAGAWDQIYSLFREDHSLLNKKDFISGYTVLHWIAKHGDHRVLNTLCYGVNKRGLTLDVNVKSSCGYTALHLATIHGHKSIIRLLVQKYKADVNLRDTSGKKPWHYLDRREFRGDLGILLGAPCSKNTATAAYQLASEKQELSFSPFVKRNTPFAAFHRPQHLWKGAQF